ncbi:DUF3307 domain-containing protein [Streptomyces sp. NPDC006798]|uniref:DUF3307 domain-containing protein n=1 Tax=Streptomyces sp. NPDC006798 TaxID=3155462 RepID=UPI0033E74462
MFAELFALLYVAHLAADYPLQTDHQAEHKAEGGLAGWVANAAHAGTHVAVAAGLLAVGAVLLDWSLSVPAAAVAVVWIGATHALIDRRWPIRWWMTHTGQTVWADHGGAAHVDQTAHIIALTAAALGLAAV